MKIFFPKIDKLLFKKRILNIQDYEGNNAIITKHIKTEIENSKNLCYFDVFIEIFNKFTMELIFSQEKETYKISIRKNGFELYSMTYKNKEKDITIILADKMYSMISEQIRNDLFIENVKKNLNKKRY